MATHAQAPMKVIPPEDPSKILLRKKGSQICFPYSERLETYKGEQLIRITVAQAKAEGLFKTSVASDDAEQSEIDKMRAELRAAQAENDKLKVENSKLQKSPPPPKAKAKAKPKSKAEKDLNDVINATASLPDEPPIDNESVLTGLDQMLGVGRE